MEKTVNYARLSKELLRLSETSRCQLIETLAQTLADAIFAFSPRIQALTLLLKKPAGLPNGDYAAIERLAADAAQLVRELRGAGV